ncbi:MAG: EAL domain-containing protein [Sulfurospirillaceae bacterium]|nr:EAL domain-containing protein [Sulfurospirillaceae bacterium]MDD2826460.1 EAL domain-containing protein [Sulfurospirillaceae bacterium]
MIQNNFENYLNLSPTVFFKCKPDEKWSVLYVSQNVQSLLGYNKEELENGLIYCLDLIYPNDLPLFRHEIEFFSHSQATRFKHTPYRLRHKDGTIIWVEKNVQIIRNQQGDVVHFFGYINDITAHKTAQIELETYKEILDSNNTITIANLDGNIVHANKEFLNNSGYTLDEILGKPHNIMRHPDSTKETFKQLWSTIQNKKIWKGLLKNKRKDGSSFYSSVSISPLLDYQGNITKYIGVRHDVTELMTATNNLKIQAQTDYITGVGNRFKLLLDIKKANAPYLILFDIVRFGEVNDFYGYKVGDALLKVFAIQLLTLLPENLNLYRINADEFIILVDQKYQADFDTMAEKLHTSLNNQAVLLDDKTIFFSVVMAISREKPEDLLSTVDIAKNYAKSQNSLFCEYRKEIELAKEYELNMYWANKIKEAIDKSTITPFFQPIFNNRTRVIEKYESLARIIDKDEIITPYYFLEIAKKTRQYPDITKQMIQKTCKTFYQTGLDFSINLTMSDILSEETRACLWESIHTYDVHKQVIIELVESENMKNNQDVLMFLERAKTCGCRLAIDDFGSGYSNFDYLIKLSATYIKIDGSIIKNININDGSIDIVKAIITFAQARNMKTVAEYVSTKEIFDTVCALGIDYSQGYYIAEPSATLFT